jgi:hypothetical protein
MFYLLVTLSLLSMGSGALVIGFGVPIRETGFGTGLLVAGSVAITGGFVLVGLAAVVAELQLAVKALRARVPGVPRPLRPPDRKEGEKRPGPSRLPITVRPSAGAPPPPQVIAEAPPPASPQPEQEEPIRKRPSPEWLRRAVAEIEQGLPPDPGDFGPDPWPRPADPPPPAGPIQPAAPEPDMRPPAGMANRFDAIWPSDRRRTPDLAPDKLMEPEPLARAADTRPAFKLPPPSAPPPPSPPPESAFAHDEQREVAILKSGVIDEMAYTLFTDGSIEAQMPDGTMRFASIDELRRHLDQHGG